MGITPIPRTQRKLISNFKKKSVTFNRIRCIKFFIEISRFLDTLTQTVENLTEIVLDSLKII